MSNKLKLITTLFLFGIFLFNGAFVYADDYGLDATGEKAGFCGDGKTDCDSDVNLSLVIGKIIGALLSFLGVIFFVLIVYGGFMWMTAGGKPEQVDKARKVIVNSTIGLIIILSAYVVTYLITTEIQSAVSSSGAG
ncbi:hypothetical protein HOD96_01145 [Candidatus Falkowbacteria bacterium]|jgi:hypothetical protein|nr:hypothetical protein [Candidatus Falkowbacteria bacterium]MBT4432925.1 hypothetical protein [Candidatus Falkowbacteria bacterium]